jgi:hypothetical protein
VDQIPATLVNGNRHDEVRIDFQVFAHIAENSEVLRLKNERFANIVYRRAQTGWIPEHNRRVYSVPIEIDSTLKFYGVFAKEPSSSLVVVSGAVVRTSRTIRWAISRSL